LKDDRDIKQKIYTKDEKENGNYYERRDDIVLTKRNRTYLIANKL